MEKHPLEIKKSNNPNYTPTTYWASSAPFVKNNNGVLIHRPRYITSHKLRNRNMHLSVEGHCGNTACGTDKFVFLDNLGSDDVVCKRCEAMAVERGYKTSDEICGKHVHVGGVKAIKLCCLN